MAKVMKKAQPGKKVTPFQDYLKKYPKTSSPQDTTSPMGYTMDADRRFKPGQRSALNSAYSKTYKNYDKDYERFDEDKVGVRRPGMKNGGKAKDGKWMQKVSKSIKARGTEGKCTPITKPGCTGRAKALAKTFKKIAAKRKAK
jgi:hypothetical protein